MYVIMTNKIPIYLASDGQLKTANVALNMVFPWRWSENICKKLSRFFFISTNLNIYLNALKGVVGSYLKMFCH